MCLKSCNHDLSIFDLAYPKTIVASTEHTLFNTIPTPKVFGCIEFLTISKNIAMNVDVIEAMCQKPRRKIKIKNIN